MSLKELNITEFYNEQINYSGMFTLKEKFEDFVVQEISSSGLCKKTDIMNKTKIEECISYLKKLNPETEIDFMDFNPKNETIIARIYDKNKEERTEIYDILRMHPIVTAKTVKDIIVVTFGKNKNLIYRFTLKKINKDTAEACNLIASLLQIPSQNLNFAGNKDKRAITYQEISITGVDFIDLYNLAIKLVYNEMNINIYDIRQSNSHIKLGELEGNRFEIRVKQITRPKKQNEIDGLKELDFYKLERGFINYFGQQRFGKNLDNHIIGELILEGKYEEAIDRIFQITESDKDIIKAAKVLFFNGDYQKASMEFPFRYQTEKWICKGRKKNLSDKKIVLSIKREMLKMYFHSYQSYIFNKEASELVRNKSQDLDSMYLELKKGNNRHMKGDKRKVIEKARDVKVACEDDSVLVSFTLNPSVYATMALREVLGDDVLFVQ